MILNVWRYLVESLNGESSDMNIWCICIIRYANGGWTITMENDIIACIILIFCIQSGIIWLTFDVFTHQQDTIRKPHSAQWALTVQSRIRKENIDSDEEEENELVRDECTLWNMFLFTHYMSLPFFTCIATYPRRMLTVIVELLCSRIYRGRGCKRNVLIKDINICALKNFSKKQKVINEDWLHSNVD